MDSEISVGVAIVNHMKYLVEPCQVSFYCTRKVELNACAVHKSKEWRVNTFSFTDRIVFRSSSDKYIKEGDYIAEVLHVTDRRQLEER